MTVGIVGHALRREHHGDIYIAGEVRQPLGVTRVGKAGKVKGVLVSGGRDDGVDFSAEREPDRGLDGVAGYAAGADDAVTILVGVSTSHPPDTNRHATPGWNVCDLIFGTDEGDLGFERRAQGACRDFGADTAWISQRHGDARRCARSRPSRLARPSRQILISMYVAFRSRSRYRRMASC
jgi:hypothetical protein